MSKVVLPSGYEFELAADGYGGGSDNVFFTILSGDTSLENLEAIFTGVDHFKVVGGDDMDNPSIVANYYGYTRVQTLTKIPEYYIGASDEDGNPIYVSVSTITCIKRAIEDRMTDVEDSIDDIVMTILGGDELLAGLNAAEENAPVEG